MEWPDGGGGGVEFGEKQHCIARRCCKKERGIRF